MANECPCYATKRTNRLSVATSLGVEVHTSGVHAHPQFAVGCCAASASPPAAPHAGPQQDIERSDVGNAIVSAVRE